jgi:transcriptional regulator with XRE-family HTH domain
MRPRSEISSGSIYAETGRRIRDYRKTRGVSQGRLAALVGLSRTSITNIERGRQKILLHTLAEIANALGVEAHELLPKRASIPSELDRHLPKDVSPKLRKLISRMVGKQRAAS